MTETLCLILSAALSIAGVTPAAPTTASSAFNPIAVDGLVRGTVDGKTSISVAIVRSGQVIFAKAYGFADRGTPERYGGDDSFRPPKRVGSFPRRLADPQTIYEIGSVTKQFTAAAIGMLVDQGKLGLDDSAQTFLPELSRLPRMTILQLLHQESGLEDFNQPAYLEPLLTARARRVEIDRSKILTAIAQKPLHFAPGSRFEYSNTNYLALGIIVERVAHQPLGKFFAGHIFDPLKMTRTFYGTPLPSTRDVAVGYTRTGSEVVHAYPWDLDWTFGAGAISSTAADLARWDVGFWNGKVVSRAMIAVLSRPSNLRIGVGEAPYASGWVVDALGRHRYLWHNGQLGGFHAMNAVLPDDGIAIVLLSNNQDAVLELLPAQIFTILLADGGASTLVQRSILDALVFSLAIATVALVVTICAVVVLRRRWWIGALLSIVALGIGLMMPWVVGYAWAVCLSLVPAVALTALVWISRRKALSRKEGS